MSSMQKAVVGALAASLISGAVVAHAQITARISVLESQREQDQRTLSEVNATLRSMGESLAAMRVSMRGLCVEVSSRACE